MINKYQALEQGEYEGLPFEFLDYWFDVYNETRGNEGSIESFVIFAKDKFENKNSYFDKN